MVNEEFLHVKELTVKRTYTSTLPPAQSQTPAKFILKSEFLCGNWCNAIEASLNFGTNGAVGGIGATISSDIILPNKTFPSGEYTTLHLSFGPQSSSAWNATLNPVSFMVLENWGSSTEFDDKAFLMNLKGLGEGDAHLYSAGTADKTVSGTLRIRIGNTTAYIMLCSSATT